MKFTTPHLTFERLRRAQQDHARDPMPWQLVYAPETATLARIQRDKGGRIVLMILEGPYDPDQAEARTAEILATPHPQALIVPAGAARH
jgi:hypothetical protein